MTTTLQDKILAEIARDPGQTSIDIAETVGCTDAYVRTIAYRHKAQFGRSQARRRRVFRLDRDVADWVAAQARAANVSAPEMLRAIIIDAMVETDSDSTATPGAAPSREHRTAMPLPGNAPRKGRTTDTLSGASQSDAPVGSTRPPAGRTLA